MYPIALCSIFALGIFLERLWTYIKVRKGFRELAHQVEPLVAKGLHDEAVATCHKSESPLAQVFLAALRAAGRNRGQSGRRNQTQRDSWVLSHSSLLLLTILDLIL